MRQPAALGCSAEDVRRISDLLRTPPVHLSIDKLRHLRILRALCEGEPGARISEREKISRQAVSKILHSVIELTPGSVIDRIIRESAGGRKAAGARPSRGRPGYERFDQWAAVISVDDEAIFELGTLLLTKKVQIATIAVREGRLSDYTEAFREDQSARRLEDAAAKALRELRHEVHAAVETQVHWTRLLLQDTLLEDVFHRLREHLRRLPPGQEGMEPISAVCLKDRFGPRFCHLVFSSGPEAVCEVEFNRIAAGVRAVHLRADSETGFLSHLERALHRRRLTKSCAGFLPMAPRLFDMVKQGSGDASVKPWLWEVGEGEVIDYLKIHALTQDYFAVRGILVGLNSYLWPKIPHQDEISFRTLPVSTRVEIDRAIAPGLLRVLVKPMPDLVYPLLVRWEGSEAEFLARARKLFRSKPNSRKFVYSTRPPAPAGIRASMAVSADFLVSGCEEKAGEGQGVVLLPRHFVTPEPEIAVTDLHAFVRGVKGSDGVFKAENHPGHGTLLVFYASYIVPAFLKNIPSFWERLAKLDDWQSSLSELAEEFRSPRIGCISHLADKLRPKAFLEPDVWDKFMHRSNAGENPTEEEIHVKVEEENAEPVTLQELESLLHEKVIPNILREGRRDPEIFRDILKAPSTTTERPLTIRALPILKPMVKSMLHGKLDEQNEIGEPSGGSRYAAFPEVKDISDLINELFLEELMQRRKTKSPDRHRDLENVLKEIDADYLIRSLDEPTRKSFERDAEEWKKECGNVIAAEYWPGDMLDLAVVRSLISAELTGWLDRHEDEISSWCQDVREQFLHNSARFAMRKLVETMQRCVLGGEPPVPVAVESTVSILRRWRGLLRATLNKKCLARKVMEDRFTGAEILEMGMADIHPDAEHSGQLGAEEAALIDLDVKEIRDLFGLLENGSEEGLRRFLQLAREVARESWQAAIEELNAGQPGAGWSRRIMDALRVCRSANAQSEGLINNLRHILF